CIYVCQSGTCRSKGSDAALIEIEELAGLVENECRVERSGCLGYCRQGPAVEVVNLRSKSSFVHVKVNTFRKSAAVVEDATGEAPPIKNLPPETESRLADIRAAKRREFFVATYQWNKALSGLTESSVRQAGLRRSIDDVLKKAGYPGKLRDVLDPSHHLEMPASIERYVQWTLKEVTAVSQHSAVFRFETRDLKRGTPHPRGRARLADPITWHVTMLGEVGANDEGPLPWIERDYTPISSALEWERGRVDILVKIYNDGALTRWLHERARGLLLGGEARVWLSRPVRTLSVPSLIADDDDGSRPKGVLLLLAGTGIVALPQILAHREPHRLLGIPVPKYKQIQCPVDLIHSCREDDILLLPEIKQFCGEGMMRPHPKFRGLRNYTLLLTKEKRREDEAASPPFAKVFNEDDAPSHGVVLKDVPNAQARYSRLDKRLVADAVRRLDRPFRVVVSGPDSFNSAAREFLDDCGVESKQVTILSA
ncbi:hypothetical protein ACHAXT_001649, partial [Thalassiosira profunda]